MEKNHTYNRTASLEMITFQSKHLKATVFIMYKIVFLPYTASVTILMHTKQYQKPYKHNYAPCSTTREDWLLMMSGQYCCWHFYMCPLLQLSMFSIGTDQTFFFYYLSLAILERSLSLLNGNMRCTYIWVNAQGFYFSPQLRCRKQIIIVFLFITHSFDWIHFTYTLPSIDLFFKGGR